MKKHGIVRRWHADRGFGFIRSPETAADVFFHVRDFRAPGGIEPAEGMKVSYEEIHMGGKGPRAMAVHPASLAATPHTAIAAKRRTDRRRAAVPVDRPSRSNWIPWLILVWLAIVGHGVMTARLPELALAALLSVNALTALAYTHDKSAAKHGNWRTKESTLHLLSLAGGWPTAWLMQNLLRHKSSKQEFQHFYAATVLLHMAVLAGWAVWSAMRLAG